MSNNLNDSIVSRVISDAESYFSYDRFEFFTTLESEYIRILKENRSFFHERMCGRGVNKIIDLHLDSYDVWNNRGKYL